MRESKLDSGWVRWLMIVLFLAWFFFCVAAYFVARKPFTPLLAAQLAAMPWLPLGSDGAAIGSALLNLGTAVWLTLLTIGVGLWPLDWLLAGRECPAPGDRLLFGYGLGIGAVGLLVLLLRLIGWLETAVLWTLVGVLTAAALPKLWSLRGGWGGKRPSRLALIWIGVLLLLTLTLALLPPTAWDGLFYHLTGPSHYLEMGRIASTIDVPHFNFPSLFQMHFLLALALRGDVAAQLLHWLSLGPLAAVVYGLAQRHLRVNGWTAVWLLAATPMVGSLATWSYNDLPLAFFSAAALHAFLHARRGWDGRWLALSGACAGLAMSMKYTSFIVPAFVGLALLWGMRAEWRRDGRRALAAPLAFGGTAVLVALPWFLKNWTFTGNPVYPFVFDGVYWDEFRAAAYANAGSGIGWDLPALLRLPYDLTLGIRDASQDGLTGPLYLALLPLLLWFVWRRWGRETAVSQALATMLWFGFASYGVWVVGVVNSASLYQSRLLLPAFVVLCAPLAWLLAQLPAWDHPQFSLHRFLWMGIGFVWALVGITLLTTSWLPAQPWAVLSGGETRDAYLTRRLGAHYLAMERLNETVSPDATVLFLWEPRSYYCRVDCRPDSILDEFDHAVYLHETAPAIAAAWQDAGITHVLLWRTGLDFIVESPESARPPDTAVLQALISNHLQPVWTVADSYELYRMSESASGE